MRRISVVKTEENGVLALNIRFKSPDQFFDREDPSDLPDKELEQRAEEAIIGYMDEFPLRRPIRLVIELPAGALAEDAVALIPEAVRHHFSFRSRDLDHDLLISRREGMYSALLMIINIIIAVTFVCIEFGNLGTVPGLLVGGLITILNWVTIWDTYEHFVYDYRYLVRKKRIFEKIIRMPIEVREYQI
jgi:hypothetical protein